MGALAPSRRVASTCGRRNKDGQCEAPSYPDQNRNLFSVAIGERRACVRVTMIWSLVACQGALGPLPRFLGTVTT